MTMTSETARRVLRSWLVIEVLTPQVTKDGWSGLATEKQGQQRNKQATALDDPGLWETTTDDALVPWKLVAERPEPDEEQATSSVTEPVPDPDQPRPWYLVILGALPAQQVFERLDAAFSDGADEDETNRRTQGHVVAATLMLDEWGVLVPDTLAIASFAWGLGHMLGGGSAAALAEWDSREQDFKARFGSILAPTDPDGRPRSLTWRDLRAASHNLAGEFGIPAELWVTTPCAIRIMQKLAPGAEILSSFLLPDLGRVLQVADDLPDAAAAYLGLHPPDQPWDALTDRLRLSSLLQPSLFPLGRWPGPGLHPLTLLQQAAVNAIIRDLHRGGLMAVNGPPGTGKTTLLRLHRAVIVAAARTIKSSLNTVARMAQGGSGAVKPSAVDWGIFFLLVPVVSTTFASVGRMFQEMGAGEIGWLLIDEAGQATPQAAMGAVWRAKRAVIIGDPLQIERVTTTPRRTMQLLAGHKGQLVR
jgi:hypothetical protein